MGCEEMFYQANAEILVCETIFTPDAYCCGTTSSDCCRQCLALIDFTIIPEPIKSISHRTIHVVIVESYDGILACSYNLCDASNNESSLHTAGDVGLVRRAARDLASTSTMLLGNIVCLEHGASRQRNAFQCTLLIRFLTAERSMLQP
jgi:hypothetical protein